ncbi:simple sugar transport system ATP-binding protein [Peribacillus deserti]|uniref:Simple sugar transport system ATP-binding protein n=1 Tax=Peribacillus deserti TaxID=673318 RepID=A0ABS2QI97_9BACI|nr:sugar ABC transporter ATP-binding protein [Peribacillus deserti]MBM7692817.1 simple sugar transport system ATP-binding protein [Peribacillus deserti]
MLTEMKDISIEFPGVKALDHVSFSAATGSVHALIGANGAGKSTLMKVLSGAYGHYTGEIIMDERKVSIRSPKDANELGIQIVYQEVDTALIPYLTVGENILLKHDRTFINWKELHRASDQILKRMNMRISSKKLVKDLSLAEKQMVLIARAVSTECRFLILDEPTAPLSHTETQELFRIVNDLKAQDVGVIFISHRLPEIFELCDEITIMRNGRLVSRDSLSKISQNEVIERMLGEKLEEQFPKLNLVIGDTLLEVKGLTDSEKIHDINLTAKAGEIIGIAGLVGAGKTELCKTLFSSGKIKNGEVLLHGKKLRLRTPHEAVKQGIALVPEERRREGILVEESVSVNLSAASLGQFTKALGFLNGKAEKEKAWKIVQSLGIKTPALETKTKHLSGGNQQKIAIGKWLLTDAEVYIFDEPTKGVDVGAKKDIYELISELAKRGKAVIYASSELSEIIGITNRLYVLYDGQVVKELQTSQTTEEDILFYSTGGK